MVSPNFLGCCSCVHGVPEKQGVFLLLPTLLDITIPPFIARDVLLLLLLLCLALIASFSVSLLEK
mgnify:CR=1 FL=1